MVVLSVRTICSGVELPDVAQGSDIVAYVSAGGTCSLCRLCIRRRDTFLHNSLAVIK